MNGIGKHTWVLGLGLIALVNAIVLGGAAYNRSGEPESTLQLSGRELSTPHAWWGNRENSGRSLRMRWRVLPPETTSGKPDPWDYSEQGYGVSPAWLNAAKMESLGFSAPSPTGGIEARTGAARQLPRDVLLVLELNGEAYQAALARATKYQEHATNGAEVLRREQAENSRLFVVDAGLERAALRAQYPDRSRFAIVRGRVHAAWQGQNSAQWRGFVGEVAGDELNLPLEWHSVFERTDARRYTNEKIAAHYQVEVRFGQRLEPWISKVTSRP